MPSRELFYRGASGGQVAVVIQDLSCLLRSASNTRP